MSKNQKNYRLTIVTKVLLGICTLLAFLNFFTFDVTELLPINLDRIFTNTNTSRITFFIFAVLFSITMIRTTDKIIGSTWLVLLIVNTINILKTTYNFITWKEIPILKTGTISDIFE